MSFLLDFVLKENCWLCCIDRFVFHVISRKFVITLKLKKYHLPNANGIFLLVKMQ